MLKVVVADMNEYKRFMTDRIAAVENVSSLESMFVMEEVKRETAYQVN